MSTQTALELLDCKYADLSIRTKAVAWLDQSLSDEDMTQYLMQVISPPIVMILMTYLLNAAGPDPEV